MHGYIDLHSHWVAGIDDGARTTQDSIELLTGLRDIGFSEVLATPHMRTGMFDNTREDLLAAYELTRQAVDAHPEPLPAGGLGAEHHLDDLVFAALLKGEGAPYPPLCRAALVELHTDFFAVNLTDRMFELRLKRIRPVLAHPERYRPVWHDIEVLEPLLDGGTVLLLNVAALVGAYGPQARRCAERLLDAGYYYAACSDSHQVEDLEPVAEGIRRLQQVMGRAEADFMLREGPRRILDGTVED